MGSKVKRTPGSWSVREARNGFGTNSMHLRVVAPGPVIPLVIAEVARESTLENARANADVLAAAPELLEVLRTTASMLAYEATCHEESGDAKRRTYVGPLRAQVEVARKLIARVEGGV